MKTWIIIITILSAILVILILDYLLSWKPRKNVWFRNRIKSYNFGHLQYITEVWIYKKGKKYRGSFKIVGDNVKYILGWRYKRSKIQMISKNKCSFNKYYKFQPLMRQGEADMHIWTYILKIK